MVVVHNDSPGNETEAESMLLSAEARHLLLADPRIRALLPLRDDATEFATDANPNVVPRMAASRLLSQSAGLIAPSPIHDWPPDLKHWINADTEGGGTSYIGRGQRAGHSHARRAGVSAGCVGDSLWRPVAATWNRRRCRSDHLVLSRAVLWCGPPRWRTLQLKWLGQAVQDFAYFHLDPREGSATKMCRLNHPARENWLPAQSPEAHPLAARRLQRSPCQ